MAKPQETSNAAIDYPKWASDCSNCKAIWHHFVDPASVPQVNLGTYEEALSTSCPNHKPLIQRFIDHARSYGDDLEEFNNGVVGFRQGMNAGGRMIFESISKRGHSWSLLLLNKREVPNHPGNGRILHTDWVDTEIAKQWKHRCLSSHGAECENPFKVSPARPAWLVDVQNRCIIPGGNIDSYVAISYTYGNYTQLSISSEDFKRLQTPFSLDSAGFSGHISPIIRHAMHLTLQIDERYLWADALCVTHHDPRAASEQLAAMGTVYSNAVVTIIATDGDSMDGIPGLNGASDSRGIY